MVLSVGALRPNKGFDFLIESLARIPQALRPPLTIVSNYQDPFERAYLESLSQCQGVDLRLLQLVDDKTLVELYNRAMLTVYAPILEPFGLVPLESMACGTPVVAVAEGGVRETVVDGVTGILVDRDTPQFAQAVCDLLDARERLTCYGRQAREYVLERWTWDAAVKRLEDHLREIASGGRRVSDGRF
jgi:glycosyltransferase involved in cell wall biosynthesis